MAWRLEIHHIDVAQGDATLIVVREVPPLIGANPIVRSALIDGGRRNQTPCVDNYIRNIAMLVNLNVMVATHYDNDHFGGLTGLLINRENVGGVLVPDTVYQNTLIFDQGWPVNNNPTSYTRAINGMINAGFLNGFQGVINRHRVTNRVRSDNQPPILNAIDNIGLPASPIPVVFIGLIAPAPAAIAAAINQPAHWLVGKEILWTDGNGNPDPTLLGGLAPAPALAVPPPGAVAWPGLGLAPGSPGGPPAIFCIAANQFVLQPGGGTIQIQGGLLGLPVRIKNEKSLAFLIQFNSFRYYIGGDIETTQEDDTINNANGIMHYLNPANNLLGRVHAIKASHHGSSFSTSPAFVNRLQPKAAFISCGTNNGYGNNGIGWPNGHPNQVVLNGLQANINLQNYYLTRDRHNDDFCARINAGVQAHPGGGHYSVRAITAGAWGPPNGGWGQAPAAPSPCGGNWPNDGAPGVIEGHIVLTVTEAQSRGIAGPLAPVGLPGTAFFDVRYSHPNSPPPHVVNH